MNKSKKINNSENYNGQFQTILRGLLESTNTSQTQLAAALGNVTRQTISEYCLGNSLPDIERFSKIADYFKVTTDYLLGKSEHKSIQNAAIGQQIGLSDDAIDRLIKLTQASGLSRAGDIQTEPGKRFGRNQIQASKNRLSVLNWLLTSDSFWSMVDSLFTYKETTRKAVDFITKYINELLKKIDENHVYLADNYEIDTQAAHRESRLELFELDEKAKEIAHSYARQEEDQLNVYIKELSDRGLYNG